MSKCPISHSIRPPKRRLARGAAGALAVALLAPAAPAGAAPTFYTDRASWLGDAGGSSFFEDFSSFATDTSFRTAAVPLDGMSIQQVGSDSFRNVIDTGPPFDFTEHDGTNHASMYTNHAGGSFPEIEVRITFDEANTAFGFDHWVAADGEAARLEIYDGVTLIGSVDLSNGFGDFTGYVLGAGESATSVIFRSIGNLTSPDVGEGFGIDALQGLAAIPEPASGALLALGLVALASGRSRRR